MNYVYVLRLKNRYYVGATKNIGSRISCHKSLCKLGMHHSSLMARDWKAFASESLETVLIVPVTDNVNYWEALFAFAFKSYENIYGYNSRFGGISSPEAYARASEMAFIRSRVRGFYYLEGVDRDTPMKDIYIRSIVRDNRAASRPRSEYKRLYDEFEERLFACIGNCKVEQEENLKYILASIYVDESIKHDIRVRSGLKI